MVEHSARDHAQWSASATERNWNCSGALALTDGLPETTNEAADWGTCAHQIAEKCLRQGVQADSFIGETEKGKKHSFEVDEEMADTAQQYVDYCRSRIAAYEAETGEKPLFFIEQRFSLADLNPPFEAGGTGDFVIYFPRWELLEIVDLKGGRGVRVSATENKQLRTYALGAMLASKGLAVKTIKSTIIQPRVQRQPKSETFHVVDLMEWTSELLEKMHASKAAQDEYADVAAGKTPLAVWAAKWLSAGDHCDKTFCKAAGFCPALEQKAFDAAGVWFDDLDQPRLANMPDADDPVKLARDLDALDMIEGWINARRARAHELAETGVEIPGYQLVEKIGHRKWKADASVDQVAALLEAVGKDRALAYAPPKPASPAQVEKALGAKHKADIADLVERPVTGTNLVAANKTSRPAAAPAVNKHFDILD